MCFHPLYSTIMICCCLGAVPVIMDEADEDILLDTQWPCYVKEEKILLALL
jgi:hypothetical protein